MREKLIALYYNSGNDIVISFIYGKVGVNYLYKYMYVCVWVDVEVTTFIPGSLKDL